MANTTKYVYNEHEYMYFLWGLQTSSNKEFQKTVFSSIEGKSADTGIGVINYM